MRNWSLQSRLYLSALAGTLLLLLVTIGIITGVSRSAALAKAEQDAQDTAEGYAHEVESTLNQSWGAAESFARAAHALQARGAGRDAVSAVNREILEANPQFIGLGSYWEPNAFDNLDAENVGKPGHDATGRYLPYFNRASGQIALEPVADYAPEKEGNQWYYTPRRTRQAWATEPYEFPIAGKPVLMVSIMVPILVNEQFAAVVGADLPLNGIRDQLAEAKPYGGYVALVSTAGAWASHPRADLLGKPATELTPEARAAVAAGKRWRFEKDGMTWLLSPVHIGKAPNPWATAVVFPSAAVLQSAHQIVSWAIGIGLASFVVLALLLWPLLGHQMKPLRDLTRRIDQWQGELGLRFEVQRNDETGTLARAFNQFMDKLGELVGSMSSSGRALVAISASLDDSARGAAHASSQQKAATAAMADDVGRFTQSIDSIVGHSQATEQLARDAERLATAIAGNITQTVDDIGAIDGAMSTVTSSVNQLHQRSGQISGVVGVIHEIANQTNLLALNAAIEAARAGESGRGFAVVADEVRKLAERTAQSTREISQTIEAMGADVAAAVEHVQTVGSAVQHGVTQIRHAAEETGQIREHTQQILAGVSTVVHEAQHQAETSSHIAGAISQISQQSEQNDQIIQSLLVQAGELRQQSHDLDRLVEQFHRS